MTGNFLAGDFLAHAVTFGDFMSGNFLAGDFLGGYRICERHAFDIFLISII